MSGMQIQWFSHRQAGICGGSTSVFALPICSCILFSFSYAFISFLYVLRMRSCNGVTKFLHHDTTPLPDAGGATKNTCMLGYIHLSPYIVRT